ncbi:MAG TPA: cytochrome c maturation protein CcmE [Spirochaetota bacterium]|nr:cytochrome c maturation protein CcmE [Spirochaetota bacterium]
MNRKKIIVFVSAVVLLTASVILMSEDLFSPYVSFAYAEKHPGKYVQIIGKRAKTDAVIHDEKGYSFSITDDSGAELKVYHAGVKPLNFEHTEKIVALGKFSGENSIFMADKILVKCPSKYEKEGK